MEDILYEIHNEFVNSEDFDKMLYEMLIYSEKYCQLKKDYYICKRIETF